jgi:hypothetical protein
MDTIAFYMKSISDDLLNGVPDYSAFTGFSKRRCYYLLENGLLPGGKLGVASSNGKGTRWVGSKRAVAEYLSNITSGSGAALTERGEAA